MSDGPSAPGWVRAAAVVGGAALYALALPPWDWSCLAWVALVPLLLALQGVSVRAGFGYGVLYGSAFGWGVTGWAAQAVARYVGMGLPLAVPVLAAFYAVVSTLTFGLFAAGTSLLLQMRSNARLAIPALWVASELVRDRVVGQPWGLLGYSQYLHPGLMQTTAVTGIYGVSFLLALASTALVEAAACWRAGARPRQTVAAVALPAALIVGLWADGVLFLWRGPAGGFAAHVVAVVQSNVPPAFAWTRAYADRQLMAHVQATETLPDTPRPALIVWPENAVTRYLEREPLLAAQLGALANHHRADLLFGAPRFEAGRTYNSVRLITSAGRDGGSYDKQHLVLFAETGMLSDQEAADSEEGPRAFSAGGAPGILKSFVPIGVSICHEIVYPELVAASVRAGAEMLVNVSNDGWLDGGSGAASRQHLAMSVVRAIETRRYLVRAATTGISAIVDPYGRVVQALPPHAPGVITASVAGRSGLTPYVRYGDLFAVSCSLWAFGAVAVRRPRLAWRQRRLASVPSA